MHEKGEKKLSAKAEDEEWIQLILEAKNLGLTVEEVREFIQGKYDPDSD